MPGLRFEIERAAERSALPPPARDLVFALARRMDAKSERIPARWQPSLGRLAADTGWSRRTVIRHLSTLERSGWITRERGTRAFHATTHRTVRYQLALPGAPPSLALATDSHPPSAGATQELVTGGPRASDPVTHSQGSSDSQPSSDLVTTTEASHELIRAARDELQRAGKRPTWADAGNAVRLVLAGRAVRDPEQYLRAALRERPADFIAARAAPRVTREPGAEPSGAFRAAAKEIRDKRGTSGQIHV